MYVNILNVYIYFGSDFNSVFVGRSHDEAASARGYELFEDVCEVFTDLLERQLNGFEFSVL